VAGMIGIDVSLKHLRIDGIERTERTFDQRIRRNDLVRTLEVVLMIWFFLDFVTWLRTILFNRLLCPVQGDEAVDVVVEDVLLQGCPVRVDHVADVANRNLLGRNGLKHF